MSRIALLVGAVPSRCKGGPIVRLLPGKYTLHVEHVVDSRLTFCVQGYPETLAENETEFKITEPTNVTLAFVERGTEKFINVFAESEA